MDIKSTIIENRIINICDEVSQSEPYETIAKELVEKRRVIICSLDKTAMKEFERYEELNSEMEYITDNTLYSKAYHDGVLNRYHDT